MQNKKYVCKSMVRLGLRVKCRKNKMENTLLEYKCIYLLRKVCMHVVEKL